MSVADESTRSILERVEAHQISWPWSSVVPALGTEESPPAQSGHTRYVQRASPAARRNPHITVSHIPCNRMGCWSLAADRTCIDRAPFAEISWVRKPAGRAGMLASGHEHIFLITNQDHTKARAYSVPWGEGRRSGHGKKRTGWRRSHVCREGYVEGYRCTRGDAVRSSAEAVHSDSADSPPGLLDGLQSQKTARTETLFQQRPREFNASSGQSGATRHRRIRVAVEPFLGRRRSI